MISNITLVCHSKHLYFNSDDEPRPGKPKSKPKAKKKVLERDSDEENEPPPEVRRSSRANKGQRTEMFTVQHKSYKKKVKAPEPVEPSSSSSSDERQKKKKVRW